MIGLYSFLTIYLLGGLTFLPLLFFGALYLVSVKDSDSTQSATTTVPKCVYPDEPYNDVDKEQGKKGWIRLANLQDGQAIGRWNTNSPTSSSKRPKDLVYGVLKHGTLFVYESDQLADCKMIIPVHDYTVSIYPEGRHDDELFSRSSAIRLKPKHEQQQRRHDAAIHRSHTDTELLGSHCSLDQDILLMCSRPIDKEDWYFSLITASEFMADAPDLGHVETVDGTHFDVEAMQAIIKMIHQDPEQREVKWLNGVMGRLFLGVYKTARIDQFLKDKIAKKVQKVKRPAFLDEITVHRVHVGQTIPYLSRFKLISLDMDGHLTAEAHVDYAGGLCVEIGTGFIWPGYSSRMKPIRLLLSVTLKRFSGKFQFKIKAPPTNRYWIGFYDMPQMDWDIKPIVSDKQIKLNAVTNAIEGKIREVIAETLVLPNMDDFVFCPSEDGKGGIFGAPVPRSTTPPSPHQREDLDPASTSPSSSSTSSSSSLPEIDHHDPTTKSAPDLLKSAAAAATAPSSTVTNNSDTASIRSVESVGSTTTVISSSSSIRWPIRRKKKTSSDTSSLSEESPARRRSFLDKINPLHETPTTLTNTTASSERRNSFYHKATEAVWNKEYTPSPPRETNPRIAKFPPPPPPPLAPPKPARQHQPQEPVQSDKRDEEEQIEEPKKDAASKVSVVDPENPVLVVGKPPLPPRHPHSPVLTGSCPPTEEETTVPASKTPLPPPPPPPPRRNKSIGEKPPLPPRSPRPSDTFTSSQPPPPPPSLQEPLPPL